NSRARPLPVGLAPGPRASSSRPPGYTPVRVLPVSGRTTYAGGRDGQTGARSPAGRDAARDAGELPGRPANGDLADGPDGLPRGPEEAGGAAQGPDRAARAARVSGGRSWRRPGVRRHSTPPVPRRRAATRTPPAPRPSR